MTVQNQIILAYKIFAGAVKDKDEYCGCPGCGSRNLTHDGSSLDNGYIACDECHYSISGGDPYEMLARWNAINRSSFQLHIPFIEYA